MPRIPGFGAMPRDRQIEILALLSKVRGHREVEESDVTLLPCGTFVAWAVVRNTLLEKRSSRIEAAIHDLYVELNTGSR